MNSFISAGMEAMRDGLGGRIAERTLFQRARSGNATAREMLIERHSPLARHLARRYRFGREPLDDLQQVANVGLVKAVDRFDPDRETPFPSFAVPTILGELKRHFRDTGWALYVPQRIRTRVLQVERATDALSRVNGRSPSAVEVARATGATVSEVVEASEAAFALETVSLDAAVGAARRAPGAEDERYELIEYEGTIEPVLRALPVRERLIIHLRFVEDMTQFEIGRRMGISQMHVSRLLRRSLTRLREVANAA